MKITFVTSGETFAPGLRQLVSIAEQHSHAVSLVHFRDNIVRMIPRKDYAALRACREALPYVSIESLEDGEAILTDCTPPHDNDLELFRDVLRHDAPDLVGFTVSWSNVDTVEELTRHVREILPRTRILWGGSHPSFYPERALAAADAAFLGEADASLPEFLRDPLRKDVPGVWTRNGDRELTRNGPAAPPQNLDELPFPYYDGGEVLIKEGKCSYVRDVAKDWLPSRRGVSSSRGCAFRCSFCIHGSRPELPKGLSYLRRKSVGRFVAEIKHAVNRRFIPNLLFWDDVFGYDEQWIEEFADVYPKKIGIPFGCHGHPNLTGKRILSLLRAAGCCAISVCLESGSERVRNGLYNRGISDEAFRTGVENAKAAGIPKVVSNMLVNTPFETEAERKETLRLLASLPRPVINHMSHLVLYPESPLAKRVAAESNPRAVSRNEKLEHLYNALTRLAQEPDISADTLLAMAENPLYREKPELVDEILAAIHRKTRQLQAYSADPDAFPLRRALVNWGYKKFPGLHRIWSALRRRLPYDQPPDFF